MAKKAPAKTTSPSSKKQNLLISHVLRGAAIALATVSASFFYQAIIDRPSDNRQQLEHASSLLAESQVTLVNQVIEHTGRSLRAFAQSPVLLAAFDAEDNTALDRFRHEFKRAFPEASSSQLIQLGPLGIAAVDKSKMRNNIELDMLRRASNGERVEPEAYSIGKQQIISAIYPVKAEDKRYASGALFIRLDRQYINDILGQMDSALGETRLQLLLNQQLIASAGETTLDSPVIHRETAVAGWQLAFTPSQQLVDNSRQGSAIIWALFAVACTGVIASAAVLFSALGRSLQDNLEQLAEREQDHYSLPGFAAIAQRLKQQQQQLEQQIRQQALLQEQDEQQVASEVASTGSDELEFNLDELATESVSSAAPLQHELPQQIPETIFRAYDIRGIADSELNDNNCFAIGLAIGSEALDRQQHTVIAACDGRHSSPRIRDAVIAGLRASGQDVIDIGMVPTPLMYFATHQLQTQSGVMITGSHNPAEYNGIKVVIDGQALSNDAIDGLRQRILTQRLHSGQGELYSQELDQSYIEFIGNDVAIAQPLKIVIDAGNGVAGKIAPQLFEDLGCEVVPLFCDIDGSFPNHHPDPSVEENLQDLIARVKSEQADLGIAFDGDGDRLGVITANGRIVPADQLLMLLAQDVVSRNPGADVVFDVKCTRNLNGLISNYGGRPIMWKSGHSYMKEKMAETGALLGGEFSGHIFFKERWFGFDDGLYAAARLIEILSTSDPDLEMHLSSFPESLNTPEFKVASTETRKFEIVEQLTNNSDFNDGKISTLDGIRVEFADGWGLVRASNTTPALTLRFEADDEEAMQRIQNLFKDKLSAIDSSLQFSF